MLKCGFAWNFEPSKPSQVINTCGLQCEDHFRQVEPSHFRQILGGAFGVLGFRPEPDTSTRRGASCASCTLLGARTADSFDEKRVDSAIGVVSGNACQAAVDDNAYSVDRD